MTEPVPSTIQFFFDSKQRFWSETLDTDPIIIVSADKDLPRHELAALLHRLAVELEESTRRE